MVDAQGPADSKTLLGTTPNGKEIYMVRRHNQTVRTIELGSGGILPEELEGGYSSLRIAKMHVDAYIAKLVAKVDEKASKKTKKVK